MIYRSSKSERCLICRWSLDTPCKKLCKACYSRRLYKTNSESRNRQLKKHREWYKDHKEYKEADNLKRKYGLTIKERDKLFKNGCNICGKLIGLTVDHNHDTGKVRGCLCRNHNFLIGRLGDTFENVLLITARIIHYLGAKP